MRISSAVYSAVRERVQLWFLLGRVLALAVPRHGAVCMCMALHGGYLRLCACAKKRDAYVPDAVRQEAFYAGRRFADCCAGWP